MWLITLQVVSYNLGTEPQRTFVTDISPYRYRDGVVLNSYKLTDGEIADYVENYSSED